ncbi:MAG: VanW family protein [Acidimicrobiales bacterium]
MEPSESIEGDELVDTPAEPNADDAFSLIDAEPANGSSPTNDTDSSGDDTDGSNHDSAANGLDPEEDADLLSVEQWLSEAESIEGSDQVTGQNMSDIMAELLAAAEESSGELAGGNTDADADAEADVDENADSDGASATDSATEDEDEDEELADEAVGKNSTADDDSADDSASDDASADDDDSADEDASDVVDVETAIDLNALDELADGDESDSSQTDGDTKTEDSDKSDAKTEDGDRSDAKAEDTAKSDSATSDSKKTATAKNGDTKEADGETVDVSAAGLAELTAKTEHPAPPTFPVKEATTEVKTSGAATVTVDNKTESTRSLPIARLLVGGVVGAYLLLALVGGLDALAHRGEAMRGVKMASIDVAGLDREALTETTDGLTDDLAAKPLDVIVGEDTIASDPVEFGAAIDADGMIDDALEAKRGGFLPLRPILWLGGLFTSENIEPRYLVDGAATDAAVQRVVVSTLDKPVEPTLELRGGEMVVNPGSSGLAVETDGVDEQMRALLDSGEPYRLELASFDSNPELANDAVTELADEINERTSQPISVRVLDDQAEVSQRTLKSWIEMTVEDGEADWVVNEQQALDDLKPLFPTLGSEDQQAKFTIVDGEPIILPASESVVCCEEGSGEVLRKIIRRSILGTVTEQDEDGDDVEVQPLRSAKLDAVITDNAEGISELESLGIIEEVSTFTTNHACCQNRVKNIQRFADLTQGVIIRPGEELSLNGHVGQRTIEKGFVADGAIALGKFEKQVGGGISQYATTFFNAAFFAGLEFLEYQSHSIYISRYPRGREATISWRRPDLKVKNNSEYGILVWNEYTPTSITVSFYSTKHLEVEALPRRRSSDRQCRIDITPRLITFPDGTEVEDSVFALYRPGEGLDCNGNSTTPEEEPEPEPPAVSTPPTTTPPPTTPPTTTPEPEPGEPEVLPPG